MKIDKQFRRPTLWEAALMKRLLTQDFTGKQAIAEQLNGVLVRTIDEDGSLELKRNDEANSAEVAQRIPIEAEAPDEDGVPIHFLLHLMNGFVKELEVYKDDGSTIKRMPQPDDLELVVLPFDPAATK